MLVFGFILRAAMNLRFKLRTSQILLSLLAFLAVAVAATPEALAQRLPKKTGREPEDKPSPSRREDRHRRPITTGTAKTPASVESGNFFDLGERFRAQKKWKAAEAAYKEAVKCWSGNVDALLELGFLYIDSNRMNEAQQTYNELRSINGTYASNLLAEINKRKNTLAH